MFTICPTISSTPYTQTLLLLQSSIHRRPSLPPGTQQEKKKLSHRETYGLSLPKKFSIFGHGDTAGTQFSFFPFPVFFSWCHAGSVASVLQKPPLLFKKSALVFLPTFLPLLLSSLWRRQDLELGERREERGGGERMMIMRGEKGGFSFSF